MATRKIKNAKDLVTDELIYFKSHAQATFMSDGTTVEDKINGLQNGGSNVDLSKYVQKTELSSVATSGNYNDLSNKPTIPSAVTESTVSGWGFTKNAGTVTGVKANGTAITLSSGVANIPAASTSAYGVTKLSSATNSTSTSLAATASAVKAAYDLANSYKGTVTGVKINGTTKNPTSGVVDLGTVITAHQTLKTINGQSIIGSGNITIEGGGGDDIRYFTEFTVEDLIEASETNDSVSGRSNLKIAVANNKLICIPHENADTGYLVASYSYKDYGDYSQIYLRLEYNGNVYTLEDGDDDLLIVNYPVSLSGSIVEWQIDNYFEIDVQDNTLYSLFAEGEISELGLGIHNILHKGSTIRFFSSHHTSNSEQVPMTIQIVGSEVLWSNGVAPEIEIDTWYELSLTTSGDASYCLAVLTPFKPVE